MQPSETKNTGWIQDIIQSISSAKGSEHCTVRTPQNKDFVRIHLNIQHTFFKHLNKEEKDNGSGPQECAL